MAVNGDGASVAADSVAWHPNIGATSHATPDSSMLSRSEDYTGGDVLRAGDAWVIPCFPDIIMMGTDSALLDTLLGRLSTVFKIRDLGTLNFFLGIETLAVDGAIIMSLRRYMGDILNRAGMTDCKPLATPAVASQSSASTDELFDNPTQYRRITGALQYLTITRPDLSYLVNRLCQSMHAPMNEHYGLLKRVLRYVNGTLTYGLCLTPSSSTDIHAYSDSDWAGCPVDRVRNIM
ncbi:uncharacterized protein LOC116027087 [Ipomoea triloba]|uniref:uncharacterized protein LOC116027087 n=1 Tax=Ipomoea triloba TaxID=35885 RepID=UPI00125D6BB8|nr:uncharacterized protein LOC116027087 [Ipomoea triloba]